MSPSARPSSKAGAPPRHERLIGVIEVGVLCGLFLFMAWGPGPHLATNGWAPFFWIASVVAFFYFSYGSPVLIHKDSALIRGLGSWRTAFFRTDQLRPALRAYGMVAGVSTLLIVAVVGLVKPRAFVELNGHAFLLKLTLYFSSAFAQGLFYLSFMAVRFRRIAGIPDDWAGTDADGARRLEQKRLAVSVTAGLIFCFLHAPNPPLMAISFVAGIVMTRTFCAYPHLWLAVLCHAWIGTLLHRLAGMYMRSGPAYWKGDIYVIRTLFPPIKRLIGNLW